MLKKNALFISGLLALSGVSAQAQQLLNQSLVPSPYSNLKTLTGYQPSVLASQYDAQKIYDSMPTDVFKGNSGCFQRAQNWTYDLNQNNGIKSMKVFLFFTSRYQREFDYEWAYHVAPLIPVKMNDGSIQDLVFDPTFTSRPRWVDASQSSKYDGKPIPVSEWIKYFIYPDVECPLVENYHDFLDFQERYYCYIMKAPMFNYIPDNFDDDKAALTDTQHPAEWNFYNTQTQVRSNWRTGDIMQMKKAYTAEHRK